MAKAIQTNIRLDPEIHGILNQIAMDSRLSINALTTNIITDFVQFYYYKIQRGDVTLSQPILKILFQNIDASTIDEIADQTAKFIIASIESQEGKIQYEVVINHFLKWNKGNHLIFNRFKQDGSDFFAAKHELGQNWSEFQCKTYVKAFENIGREVREIDYKNQGKYSFEVINHQS